jgi:hypothetical protein
MVAVAAERQARSARRLNEAAQHAPIDAVEAAAQALGTLVRHHERSTFVTWVLRTLVENEIADLEELIEVLGRPEVLADLRRRDPLAAARLRGLRAQSREGNLRRLLASRVKPWTSAASPAS